MLGRSVRIACLAIAAWALLFAPGAVGAEVSSAVDASHSDRVAAAVLAPTFDSDSVARSVRSCGRSVEDEVASDDASSGHLVLDRSELSTSGGTTMVSSDPRHVVESSTRTSVCLRAPPSS